MVWEDLHLVVRERDREEPRRLDLAIAGLALGRVTGTGLADRMARAHRARGAVVAVGDVEAGNRPEGVDQPRRFAGGRPPHRVRDAVRGGEVEQRRSRLGPR